MIKEENMQKKLDILDLVKFILSLMIVAIHTNIYPKVLYPWLRLAIPLFLIISSFLLFRKISENPKDSKEIVKKYLVRLLKLYLFWFIVLLPYTILIRKWWFDNGILHGLIKSIYSLLFSSTFPASWYLTAIIEGTLVVYLLSKKLNNKILFIIFLLCYILCCISSSYNVFLNLNIFGVFKPHFCFLVTLIYILIGKMFAEKKININLKYLIILLIVFAIGLFFEWRLIVKYTNSFNKDCYLMLLPVSICIFGIIKNININLKYGRYLRQFSSFIYPLHYFLIFVVNYIFTKFISNFNLLPIYLFVITTIISLICFLMVKWLENKKKFKFLKYSY